MRLGTIGVWCGAFTVAPAAEARPAAREIEALGYDTLWYSEGLGTRESFTNAAVLLAATDRLQVASGIANIWARDAVSAANAARVLSDAFDDRYLLGLGVSHPRQVDPRGHTYRRPVATMRAFLDAMDDDPFVSPDGPGATRPPVPRVLAALRPPMLRLAAEKALGAHTFLVPVEHTRRAREILGPDALLVVEQKVVLADEPVEARERARAALAWYLDTPNYLDNLRWLGFGDDDFETVARTPSSTPSSPRETQTRSRLVAARTSRQGRPRSRSTRSRKAIRSAARRSLVSRPSSSSGRSATGLSSAAPRARC